MITVTFQDIRPVAKEYQVFGQDKMARWLSVNARIYGDLMAMRRNGKHVYKCPLNGKGRVIGIAKIDG